MHLESRGHPLHSRAQTITLTARGDGKLDVRGSILDLRKRGFVPVAGDLQASGVIHDMHLRCIVDPAGPVLEDIAAEQRSVAFEPSATTAGESCRDPIGRIAALAGARLDATWAKRLATEIGGPRGCSHLLTLAHLLGSTVGWALAREPVPGVRRAGERVFRRDLVVDGHEPAPGRLELTAQLLDLHLAPSPPVAPPMDRFAEALDVRLQTEIEFPAGRIVRIAAAERRRTRADIDRATWRDRAAATSWLVGERLASGVAGALIARLGDVPDDRPLLDTCLALAPTMIQCAAAMSEAWAALGVVGGIPDSCWMWRRDGALDRARPAGAARARS